MVGLLSQIFDGLCNNTITVDPILVDLPDDENHEMHNPDDNHMGHLKLVAQGKKKKNITTATSWLSMCTIPH